MESIDETRIQAAIQRGVRKALGHEGGDLQALSDDELCQRYYEELGNSLPEATSDVEMEMDARDLDVDCWVVLDVHDAEGNEVFHEGG